MEAPDTRGAGGRAPRNRGGATPGKIIGLVSSPLQLLSKTVKGLVGSSPKDSHNRTGAAALRPSPPVQQRQTGPTSVPKPKVEDGTNGFSFPTLAAARDSPPTNSLSRPAAPPSSAQPRVTVDVPAQANQTLGSMDSLLSGWSPSKLASLNFFMNGAKSGTGVLQPTAPTAAPDMANFMKTPEPPRPYFNLTAMLRAGPGGIVSETGGIPGGVAAAKLSSGGGAVGPAMASRGARYNPYGRPNAPRPPRPGASTAPSSSTGDADLGAAANVHQEIGQRQPVGQPPKPSLAVASARLPPSGPRVAPVPTGAAPRQPTAPGAVRLAPGQVAFASGRTGTPLPKFGASAAAGQGQQQAAAQTPGGFRPLAGAVGAKRQRDSPAVSPLMASGVRNLSEFKRRRSAVPQQPRCVLAGLSSRTPREKDAARCDGNRTPGAVGSGGTGPAVTPAPLTGGVAAAELPATETARKILETLDNFKRVGDNNTPSVAAAKAGGVSAARSGAPTGSPFPGPFMPPLDKLDQNHYGGTPTPSVTTGAPGFVCGATPSPSGNAASAGPTPGPRMVLDFKTPGASPSARHADGTSISDAASANPGANNALPLSPIAVPPPAPGTDRSASSIFAPAPAAEAPSGSVPAVLQRTDATAAGSSPASAEKGSVQEPASTSAPHFSFTSPRAPTDPVLRQAKEACEANAAGATLPDSLGAVSFTFGAPMVGVNAPTSKSSVQPPSSVLDVRASSHASSEVLKAAATPLPDDDDEESEGAAVAAATPVALDSALDERPLGQSTRSATVGSTKRVAFVEQPEAVQAGKQKDADGPLHDGPTVVSSTPPATPGGFFNSNAGSTPFRPCGADLSPAAATVEKQSAAAEKDDSRQSLFAFGASTVTAAAAPADGGKSTPIFTFSQPSAPSSFNFGTLPQQGAVDNTTTATAAAKKSVPEASRAETANQNTNSMAAPAGPAKEPAPVFGSFGAPAATVAAPMLMFGATQPSASADASAAAVPTAVAPAFGASTQSLTPSGGAAPVFGGSSAPAASPAPAVGFGGSAPTFGVAAASTPTVAPVLGFTFGAASSTATATGTTAPSASSAAASASFSFGPAPTGVGASPIPAFGSPMPVSNASSAPSFGAPQPSSAPAVFGSGGFGTASGAATSFTFGAQANSGSSGGTGTASSMGFGAQQGTSNQTPAFSFGCATSAPSFGASASAPSFGTGSAAAQPAFGTTAPTFGGSNPFPPSAVPSFTAPSSQPAFGTGASVAAPAFGAASVTSTAAPSFGGFGGSNGGAPATGMFAFGGSGAPTFGSSQPVAAPVFGQAAPTFGMSAPTGQAPAPTVFAAAPAGAAAGFPAPQGFGGASPAPPAGDAGGGFSIGAGDAREGRKRVKARRHGG